MFLSLQGCMAVGKTNAARYLQEHAPYLHISWEDPSSAIAEVRRRGLSKDRFEDYLEIQRIWIKGEIRRHEEAVKHAPVVMDFGAEEIEFHTLNYPRSIGKDRDVENYLEKELAALRACLPDRILFLEASEATLQAHKDGDSSRGRRSFDSYLRTMLPLKQAWFQKKNNVDYLQVDGLSPLEVGERVKQWCDAQLQPPHPGARSA